MKYKLIDIMERRKKGNTRDCIDLVEKLKYLTDQTEIDKINKWIEKKLEDNCDVKIKIGSVHDIIEKNNEMIRSFSQIRSIIEKKLSSEQDSIFKGIEKLMKKTRVEADGGFSCHYNVRLIFIDRLEKLIRRYRRDK